MRTRLLVLLLGATVVLAPPAIAEPPSAGMPATALWSPPMDGDLSVTRPFEHLPHRFAAGHRGADLRGAPGSQVLAAGAGVVVFAGMVAGRPVMSIDHPGGLRTTYEPVDASVAAGQSVARGSIIGTLVAGHAGCPVEACLHWGLRRGEIYLDPFSLLRPPRVRLLPMEWSGADPVEGGGADQPVGEGGPQPLEIRLLEPAPRRTVGHPQALEVGGDPGPVGVVAVGHHCRRRLTDGLLVGVDHGERPPGQVLSLLQRQRFVGCHGPPMSAVMRNTPSDPARPSRCAGSVSTGRTRTGTPRCNGPGRGTDTRPRSSAPSFGEGVPGGTRLSTHTRNQTVALSAVKCNPVVAGDVDVEGDQ